MTWRVISFRPCKKAIKVKFTEMERNYKQAELEWERTGRVTTRPEQPLTVAKLLMENSKNFGPKARLHGRACQILLSPRLRMSVNPVSGMTSRLPPDRPARHHLSTNQDPREITVFLLTNHGT